MNDRLPKSLTEQGEPPYVVAHRGSHAIQPENSMAAFHLALEQGAHALETDLHITKDRHIVCIHDPTLDRTTDSTGHIQDMTLAEVQQASMSNGEQVPTLDEFFTSFAQRTFFLLELKAPSWTTAEDVELLTDMVAKYDVADRLVLVSFEMDILQSLSRHAPDLPNGPIFMASLFPPGGFDVVGVAWPMLFINPLYVWLCHRRGQIFCPLDPAPEPRLRYYKFLGVQFVLSNNPEKTLKRLK